MSSTSYDLFALDLEEYVEHENIMKKIEEIQQFLITVNVIIK
ncbi:16899_t:CDS:1, partial [Funneliformis geosporum]